MGPSAMMALRLVRRCCDAHRRLAARHRQRVTVLEAEMARLRATVATLEALRALPFDGACVMPAEFVDELVRAYEEGRGEARHAKAPTARSRRRALRRAANLR